MRFWDEISTRLAALSGSATPEEARQALNEFDTRDIQAVRVSEGGGGNGGSLPIQTGVGSPVDTVTPTDTGYVYINTANGSIYQAIGPTNTDWIAFGATDGSINIGSVTGIVVSDDGNRLVALVAGERDTPGATAYFTDAYSQWNGHGQGVVWQTGATEGEEHLDVTTGATGQHVLTQNGAGTLRLADGGIVFPLSDPGISGAWWDNNGVLTKSTG